MEKITRQKISDDVVKRWAVQYPLDGHYGNDAEKQDILKKLRALPKGTHPDEIDAAIGNGSWTDLTCDDCGASTLDVVIQIGQEPDYESSTALVCRDCLEKALRLTDARQNGTEHHWRRHERQTNQ